MRESSAPGAGEIFELLTGAMHDLRQPVQSLVLLVRVALQSPDAERRDAAMGHMEPVLTGLLAMISTLDDLSRLEAGLKASRQSPCDVARLIERLGPELEVLARASGKQLVVEAGRAVARCDELLLAAMARGLVASAARLADADVMLSCSRPRRGVVVVSCRFAGRPFSDQQWREVFVPPADSDGAAAAAPGPGLLRRLAPFAGATLSYRERGRTRCLELHLEEAKG